MAWPARHKAAIGKQRMARVTQVARVACVFMQGSLKKQLESLEADGLARELIFHKSAAKINSRIRVKKLTGDRTAPSTPPRPRVG
jgi:hypothetical protein